MTDRELLELAAKAAGFQYDDSAIMPPRALYGCFADARKQEPHWWNPIHDNGDAFYLLVRMRISCAFGLHDVCAGVTDVSENAAGEFFLPGHNSNDPYAATRRAIVRTAAEIGRSMK